MDIFWLSNDIYNIAFNQTTKSFYVDFIEKTNGKVKKISVLHNLVFIKYWRIGKDAFLIALRDKHFLYISSKIIHFTMEPGDMVIRLVPSLDRLSTCLMTRFNTILFNQDNEPWYLLDKRSSRPPELLFNFVINDEFKSNYAMLYHNFILMHNGRALQDMININV